MSEIKPEYTESEGVMVEAYGLWDFLKALQDKIKEGYEIDFETNQGAPTVYGAYYVTRVVKAKVLPDVLVPDALVPAKKTKVKSVE